MILGKIHTIYKWVAHHYTTCLDEFPNNKFSDPREKEDDERDVAEQELRLRELLKANEELRRKVAEVNYQIKYLHRGFIKFGIKVLWRLQFLEYLRTLI